ncbi:MAG: tetraacyldisaccharide 4'-kinase [Saprospiraceae bacterium]|nr:tetraacyldisaccharide 4'-kinase [Saprospiraceae bacterium]
MPLLLPRLWARNSSMIQKILFKILVSPFALLYGFGVSVHNGLYKWGLLKGVRFAVPVIGVGNLTVGGAGKSPHVEYLVRWLQEYLTIGILSRGYRRKTKGYRIVHTNSNVQEVGDEPLQFKRKFPQVGVYVCESRVIGIPNILRSEPETQLILLDDSFQHRAVQPQVNLLLTEYSDLFIHDHLLPVGRLREWRAGYKRADAIVVTKCPLDLDEEKRAQLIASIKPLKHQRVFFSSYQYGHLRHLLYPSIRLTLHAELSVIVISGIARVETLIEYVRDQVHYVKSIEYADHHQFTNYEVAQLKASFDQLDGEQKIIVTTQKDAVRLEKHRLYLQEQQLPIFVLPVFVTFNRDEENFQTYIRDSLLDFKA